MGATAGAAAVGGDPSGKYDFLNDEDTDGSDTTSLMVGGGLGRGAAWRVSGGVRGFPVRKNGNRHVVCTQDMIARDGARANHAAQSLQQQKNTRRQREEERREVEVPDEVPSTARGTGDRGVQKERELLV